MLESGPSQEHLKFQRPAEVPPKAVAAVDPDFLDAPPVVEEAGNRKESALVSEDLEGLSLKLLRERIEVQANKFKEAMTAYVNLYKNFFPQYFRKEMDEDNVLKLRPPSKINAFLTNLESQRQGIKNLYAAMHAARFQLNRLESISDVKLKKAYEEADAAARSTLDSIKDELSEGCTFFQVREGKLKNQYVEIVSIDEANNTIICSYHNEKSKIPISHLFNWKEWSKVISKLLIDH